MGLTLFISNISLHVCTVVRSAITAPDTSCGSTQYQRVIAVGFSCQI